MVFLRLSVKVPLVENLQDYRAFLVVLHNPEDIIIEELTSIIAQKWKELEPNADSLNIKKLLNDDHPINDLDAGLTVADVFVDIGKAAVDGFDQRATVRVVRQSTAPPRSSVPSFAKSTSINSHASAQHSGETAESGPPIVRIEDDGLPIEARDNLQRKIEQRSGSKQRRTGATASSRGDVHPGRVRKSAKPVEANRLSRRLKGGKANKEQKVLLRELVVQTAGIERADNAERHNCITRIGDAVDRLRAISQAEPDNVGDKDSERSSNHESTKNRILFHLVLRFIFPKLALFPMLINPAIFRRHRFILACSLRL